MYNINSNRDTMIQLLPSDLVNFISEFLGITDTVNLQIVCKYVHNYVHNTILPRVYPMIPDDQRRFVKNITLSDTDRIDIYPALTDLTVRVDMNVENFQIPALKYLQHLKIFSLYKSDLSLIDTTKLLSFECNDMPFTVTKFHKLEKLTIHSSCGLIEDDNCIKSLTFYNNRELHEIFSKCKQLEEFHFVCNALPDIFELLECFPQCGILKLKILTLKLEDSLTPEHKSNYQFDIRHLRPYLPDLKVFEIDMPDIADIVTCLF